MLDLRLVVENPDRVRKSLEIRGSNSVVPMVDEIIALDRVRRSIIQIVEELKAQRNKASAEIARLKKSGEDVSPLLQSMKAVADSIKLKDEELSQVESRLQSKLLDVPNVLQSSVPTGKDSSSNVEVRSWGTILKFPFMPLSHDEIGLKQGILDFDRAGTVTGARFVFLRGRAARLERALVQFMMDTHAVHGYEEMIPPYLVNRQSLIGTGQFPKFEEEVFHVKGMEYFLIPTAEVPVTNFHRGEILSLAQLPIKYVAFSPCFRSEAGNYGKDTRGIKRQHQFHKVELVMFCVPEQSFELHELLTRDAERILQLLELPYRVLTLCGGDTGFSSAKTYDIEVWSPGSNSYIEISSCSNFEDFQARRANIRYRNAVGKVRYIHTLNGSGLAIGRTMIAIMENYQSADGSFEIPKVLEPYL